MRLMNHDEFMALEGHVLFTEHHLEKGGAGVSYSNYGPLMIRDQIIGGTHFETIIIDSDIHGLYEGFDILVEPYTIKGYESPDKIYRVFNNEDIDILIAQLNKCKFKDI